MIIYAEKTSIKLYYDQKALTRFIYTQNQLKQAINKIISNDKYTYLHIQEIKRLRISENVSTLQHKRKSFIAG